MKKNSIKVMLMILLSLIILVFVGCGDDSELEDAETEKTILVEAPLSNEECQNKYAGDIYDMFVDAGFKIIGYMSSEFEYDNSEYVDGQIVEVRVNGEIVEKGKEYKSKDVVQIYIAEIPFAKEVSFGMYEQNNDSDSKEPIIWYVVATEGDRSLLVSKEILDYKAFNDTTIASATSWKNSSLRKWLNESFYIEAFSNNEKKAIVETTVQDYKADKELGETTKDKVFILSYEEAWSYFPSDSDRATTLTNYAKEQKSVTNDTWWLINSYSSDLYKYVVNSSGEHENSPRVNEDEGVRPAIWVKTSAID